jgi:hypothetical protein
VLSYRGFCTEQIIHVLLHINTFFEKETLQMETNDIRACPTPIQTVLYVLVSVVFFVSGRFSVLLGDYYGGIWDLVFEIIYILIFLAWFIFHHRPYTEAMLALDANKGELVSAVTTLVLVLSMSIGYALVLVNIA